MAGFLAALAFGPPLFWNPLWGPLVFPYPWFIGTGAIARGRRRGRRRGYSHEEEQEELQSFMDNPDRFLDFVSDQVDRVKVEDLKQAKYSIMNYHKRAVESGDDDAASFFNSFHYIISSSLSKKLGKKVPYDTEDPDFLPEDISYEIRNKGRIPDRESQFHFFSSMESIHSPEKIVDSFMKESKEWKNNIRGRYLTISNDSDPPKIEDIECEEERKFVSREFDYRKILSEHDLLSFQYIASRYMNRMFSLGHFVLEPKTEEMIKKGKDYPILYTEDLSEGLYKSLVQQIPDWNAGIDFAVLRGVFIQMQERKLSKRGRERRPKTYDPSDFRGEDPRSVKNNLSSVVFDKRYAKEIYEAVSTEMREEWDSILKKHIDTEKKAIDWIFTKTKDFATTYYRSGGYTSQKSWFREEEDYKTFLMVMETLEKDIAEEVSSFWAKIIGYSLGEKRDLFSRKQHLKDQWVMHTRITIDFAFYMVDNGIWNTSPSKYAMEAMDIYKTGKSFGEVLNDMLYLELGQCVPKRRIIALYQTIN